MITAEVKQKMQNVISVFETGTIRHNYGSISIFADGRYFSGVYGKPQLTFGAYQLTSDGNLKHLLQTYIDKENAIYKDAAKSLLFDIRRIEQNRRGQLISHELYFKWVKTERNKIARQRLIENTSILNWLQKSGQDPAMIEAQNETFETQYFTPAQKWATDNGFTLPLSMLVIYDSYIHSGRILMEIRSMFAEVPPFRGGDEKKWIDSYVKSRKVWLRSKNALLAKTVYRMDCFLDCLKNDNWQLDKPINANGTVIQ